MVLGICIVCSFIFGLFGFGTSVDVDEGVAGWYGAFGPEEQPRCHDDSCRGGALIQSIVESLRWVSWGPSFSSYSHTR